MYFLKKKTMVRINCKNIAVEIRCCIVKPSSSEDVPDGNIFSSKHIKAGCLPIILIFHKLFKKEN